MSVSESLRTVKRYGSLHRVLKLNPQQFPDVFLFLITYAPLLGVSILNLLHRVLRLNGSFPEVFLFSELYAQVTPTIFELDTSVMHSKFTFTVSGYYGSGCNPVMERIRKPYSAPTVVLRLPHDEFDFHPGRHEEFDFHPR